MSPSADQLQNLSEMAAILSGNWKATFLAHSLWEFYNYRLYCTVLEDDGEPNTYHIGGIIDANMIGDIRISISIRRNARRQEGLTHELLHANLIPLGYPRFWINEEHGSDKWVLASGIINLADHIIMRPIYLSFGYSVDRFLGLSRPLNEQETRFAADLEGIGSALSTPVGYSAHVEAYLQCHDISFQGMNSRVQL